METIILTLFAAVVALVAIAGLVVARRALAGRGLEADFQVQAAPRTVTSLSPRARGWSAPRAA